MTAYLAADGYTELVCRDVGEVIGVYGRLVLAKGGPRPTPWCHNVWYDASVIPITSIKDAARKLTALQRNWCLYSYQLHRRAKLIQSELPFIKFKPLRFPTQVPQAPLGSWTLLEENLLLASPRCSSPFPNGEPVFAEDKENPPSRAYLKLWEAFLQIGRWPAPGERCLELGASPGGWTWVLGNLGAEVTAVDRAPLDPRMDRYPNVHFRQGNAFGVKPGEEAEPLDWLFSDLICYPDKLLEYVREWLDTGRCRNFVCTLKFQGETHYEVIRDFMAIPQSHLMHLSVNKHELTWVRLATEPEPLATLSPSSETERPS